MKTHFKKIVSLTLIMLLSIAPVAYAQEVPADTSSASDTTAPADTTTTPQVADTTTPMIPILDISSSQQSADLQGSVTTVQDTTNTQLAVDSSTLESTSNPESASTTDATAVPIIDIGTTTPVTQPVGVAQGSSTEVSLPLDISSSTLDVVSKDVEGATTTSDSIPLHKTISQLNNERAQTLSTEDLTPEPEFIFALSGKQIPTKKKILSGGGASMSEQAVSAPLATQVDNAAGIISVSGQCSDAYFVVLLYKNQEDYANNASSYIVNRAYPCVNGAYSYELTRLPHNLANGTYYLLVGQEGEHTTWTPITSLTEITINNN